MSTGMFHKCQMGIEFDIYEWGKINFFLPHPRNIVENWNRPLTQPYIYIYYIHFGMSMKTGKQNVLNVCIVYACVYIHW